MSGELKRYNFHIRLEQLKALRNVEKRDGIVVSEQIRRAIDLWLNAKKPTRVQARKLGA